MLEYPTQKIAQAAAAMAHAPHMEVLETYLPQLLQPYTDNSLSRCGAADFQATALNMATGKRLDLLVPYLTRHPLLRDTDVLLASELDCGMARSGNTDVTQTLAKALGMNYAFGMEFLALDAGTHGNGQGLGGNAILSRYPLSHTAVIHLPIEFDWFGLEGEPRFGTRIALAAEITAGERRVGVCSAHLDNRCSPAGRAHQMAWLLRELDRIYGDIPMLIGGDMNTNTIDGDQRHAYEALSGKPEEQARRMASIPRWEPLMDCAVGRGYRYDTCNLFDKCTRLRPDPAGELHMNLDWFFSRGLACDCPGAVSCVFDHTALEGAGADLSAFDGQYLSDHYAITVHCRPGEAAER
jgi:endonuclease/exonuclease/phosphatase family metal-dependent hydrolase